MARFIKIPSGSGEIYLLNTDMVETVLVMDESLIVFYGAKNRVIAEHECKTKAEAVEFLDKNFVLFNS